ncbi:MAG: GNAT family N-acetyltransferase [Candidatus Niameybacter stercoravium]|nr:GNAT family N-acetyltransferase [Candidatus Niameybacter stercoravium]
MGRYEGSLTYYEYFKMEPNSEKIKENLTGLPPNTTMEDKYFTGFYERDKLVAILDLITGYPTEDIAYICWFMMNKEFQYAGIGSAIITEIILQLKEKHVRSVQLEYIKGNQQSQKFGVKNKFIPTGSEVEEDNYTIITMQREI